MPAGSAAVVARKRQQNRAKKLQEKVEAKNAAIDVWFKKYDKRSVDATAIKLPPFVFTLH